MGPLPQGNRQVPRLGSMAARLKLKGIDGDPHKQRSVWFNSMRREAPYLDSMHLAPEVTLCPRKGRDARCCMAVVSSCREVLG